MVKIDQKAIKIGNEMSGKTSSIYIYKDMDCIRILRQKCRLNKINIYCLIQYYVESCNITK